MTSMQSDPPARPRAFGIGHSHLVAVQQGYKDLTDAGAPCRVELVFAQLLREEFKPEIVDGQLGTAVAKAMNAASWDAVISAVAGNLYNWLGFVSPPRKFDFVSPDAPDAPLAEGAEIVPASAIRRRMVAESQDNFALMKALRAATKAPMFHLQSPPPIPSEAHISKHPGVFKTAIEANSVTPALIRWKLWKLQSGIFQEFCVEHDIEFIAPPSDMVDENGMLAEIGWPLEPTHANRL